MKNLFTIMFLLSFSIMSAQKVKMKDGTVYVDKKEFLKYEGNSFYTFDGVRLFSVERITSEKLGNTSSEQISSRTRTNTTNAQLVTNNNVSVANKVRYTLVKFSMFDLEFETSLSQKKVIRSFYRGELINKKGLVDESKAWEYAKKAHQNISGTREKLN